MNKYIVSFFESIPDHVTDEDKIAEVKATVEKLNKMSAEEWNPMDKDTAEQAAATVIFKSGCGAAIRFTLCSEQPDG